MIALLYSAFLILTFAVSTKSLGCITKTLSSKNVNCLFAPGNILPIFPLFCKKKVLVLHDVSFYYSSKKFGKRNLRQKLGTLFRKILVPISLKISISNRS